jgi:hypothetical protein
MNEKNLKYLKEQLHALGFPARIAEEISHDMKGNKEAFHIYYSNQIKEDELMFDLRFIKRSENEYQLKEYELTYKHINIADLDIQGINTKDLDRRLSGADALYNKYYQGSMEDSMSRQEYEQLSDFIKATNNDLYKLAEVEEGREAAKLLMYKYFPESEYAKSFQDYSEMQKLYEHKYLFRVNDNKVLTAKEAYEFLKAEINPVRRDIQSDAIDGHIISDEAIYQINSELVNGNWWIAYNTISYHLDVGDVYLFKSKEEADDFAESNISDFDKYQVKEIKPLTNAVKTAANEMLKAPMEASSLNKTNLFTQKTNIMNQKNFEYLRDQVKYTGFGEGLENDLKQKMEDGKPEFKLQHQTQYGNDSVTATLNFSQSKQSDMYFFNSYQVSLQKENSPETMEQTFYINKAGNITLKEAYNLMEGRSVNKDLTNKEGQVYNAWIQMNFKQSDNNGNFKLKHYHQNYGYDLEAVLSKHPIKELSNDEYKSNLFDSLKKGNLQSATFQMNGTEQKQFIEANPQFKTINIYDHNMQRIDNRQSKAERKAENENQSAKQDNRKEKRSAVDDDGPEIPKSVNKKKRKKAQAI